MSKVNKLTIQQQEHLIDLVQEHSCIYDAGHNDHKNRLVIQNTWRKMARELDVDGVDGK